MRETIGPTRRRPDLPVVLVLALAALLAGSVHARADEDGFEYEGVYSCRKCHSITGREYYDDAYEVWKKSPHARAYETLGNARSKEIAAKLGVSDPQSDGRCLRCHVTAWGVDESRLGKFYAREEGVVCESCHGPGGSYKKKQVHAESYQEALTKGFRPIATREEVEETCARCHNAESPTYEPDPISRWYEWQHPTIEGRDGVEGPAKKDRGDWVPKPNG